MDLQHQPRDRLRHPAGARLHERASAADGDDPGRGPLRV